MGFVPVALAFITLGAAGAYGAGQYRKMKRELPDDREVRPEDKIANPQSLPTYGNQTDRGEAKTAPIGQ